MRGPRQDGLELAVVAAVDASPEEVPRLGGSAQCHADLDRALEQVVQPRPAMKDHVAGEFDLGYYGGCRLRRFSLRPPRRGCAVAAGGAG